jgi:hypothetical protein
MLKRYNEAIIAYNKAIKLDSNKVLLYYSKGKIQFFLSNLAIHLNSIIIR